MDFSVVKKEAEQILKDIDKKEYPNLYDVFLGLIEDYCFEDTMEFCAAIMNSDTAKQIPAKVAQLLVDMLKDEIDQNNKYAMCDLGSLYYTGRIGEQSFEKAVYYYEMSSQHGNKQAEENLGYCYYYGRLGEVDYKKAFHYFVRGALSGSVVSKYKVGDMYKNGYYVEKDERLAFEIYINCYMESADVYIRIADCYFYGIGVEKDFDEALEYYQKAEVSYISRLRNGDFMYKKQYERAIAMQQKCREEIQNNMPSYDWIKTDY